MKWRIGKDNFTNLVMWITRVNPHLFLHLENLYIYINARWESITPKNNELKKIKKKSYNKDFPKKGDEKTYNFTLEP